MMRRLLEENERVIDAADCESLSLNASYSEEIRRAIQREYGHPHVKVCGLVLEDYDPVQTMEARRRGFDPDGIGG